MRICLWLSIVLSASVYAAEADYTQFNYGGDHYQACEASVLTIRAGHIIKVELKREAGRPVYEFDVRAADTRDWDVSCDAQTHEVIELEEEVPSVQHPLFARKKEISEKQARDIALDAWPGYIIEIEYEIEADGAASYEFDIQTNKGAEMKVEVDASTGDISEQNEEIWQEGYE